MASGVWVDEDEVQGSSNFRRIEIRVRVGLGLDDWRDLGFYLRERYRGIRILLGSNYPSLPSHLGNLKGKRW